MRLFSASDAKNRFGQALECAIAEPVAITKSGRTVAFLVSATEYQRLSSIDEERLARQALEDEKKGYLSQAESDELLNALLK